MKKFHCRLTVFLGVSLFLWGCSLGEELRDALLPPGPDAEGVKEALGEGNATVEGNTVTLAQPTVPLTVDLTIPAEVVLVVPFGTGFIVSDKTLTVEGIVEVKGGGTFTAPALGPDGLPSETGRVSFSDDGKVELAYGSIGYYGSSRFISGDVDSFYQWNKDVLSSKVTLKGNNTTELTSGKVTVQNETGIAAETTITVASGAALTVAEGKAFVVDGTLSVSGEFSVAGTLFVTANGVVDVKSGGTYILESTGNGSNEGTVNIRSGGVTWGKGGVVVGDGLNVVEYGGKAMYTNPGDSPKTMIGTAHDAEAIFQLAGVESTLSFNNWDYILDGSGTLASSFALYASRHQTLTVLDSSTLTIAPTAYLIGNTSYDFGGLEVNEGDISIVVEGTIILEGVSPKNFYNSSGTGEAPSTGTFNWDTTVGGGTGGWKKQS